MKKSPKHFGFSVSHTTRQPRAGEENGIHYNFVDKTSMEEAIARGEFIEYANVHTNIYGTSYAAVEKVQANGKICILDIDIQGVQNVQKSTLKCKYIFIAPPSMEILEQRLRGRGTETEDKIQVRLQNAIKEIEFGSKEGVFDIIITNDDLDKSLQELISNISRWYPDRDFTS
jgi:guanylate kinase